MGVRSFNAAALLVMSLAVSLSFFFFKSHVKSHRQIPAVFCMGFFFFFFLLLPLQLFFSFVSNTRLPSHRSLAFFPFLFIIVHFSTFLMSSSFGSASSSLSLSLFSSSRDQLQSLFSPSSHSLSHSLTHSLSLFSIVLLIMPYTNCFVSPLLLFFLSLSFSPLVLLWVLGPLFFRNCIAASIDDQPQPLNHHTQICYVMSSFCGRTIVIKVRGKNVKCEVS